MVTRLLLSLKETVRDLGGEEDGGGGGGGGGGGYSLGKWSSVLLMMTSMMGSGILSVPLFFYHSGIFVALLFTFLNSVFTILSVRLLLSNLLIGNTRNYFQVCETFFEYNSVNWEY